MCSCNVISSKVSECSGQLAATVDFQFPAGTLIMRAMNELSILESGPRGPEHRAQHR
jgi:hypothetical protein